MTCATIRYLGTFPDLMPCHHIYNESHEGRLYGIYFLGLENQNRAVNGDTVAIELLDKQNWEKESEIVLEDDPSKVDTGDTLDGDELEGQSNSLNGIVKQNEEKDTQPTGKIVGIIKRKWRQYCGMLVVNPIKGSTKHTFVAADKLIPKVRIETRQAEQLKSKRIMVALDSWPRHSRYPLGHFVRTIGTIGDKPTEIEVVLLEHDIPHSKFSQEVLDCLPTVTPDNPWEITQQDRENREDFRGLLICSVDPPGMLIQLVIAKNHPPPPRNIIPS